MIPSTNRTSRATIARREEAEFHHKATLALTAYGTPRADIMALLGISRATFHRFLKTRCIAYEIEMKEVEMRREDEQRMRTERGHVIFYRKDDSLTDKAIHVRDMRAKIKELWAEGLSVAGIAFELDVSRQVIEYHLKAIQDGAEMAA